MLYLSLHHFHKPFLGFSELVYFTLGETLSFIIKVFIYIKLIIVIFIKNNRTVDNWFLLL